MRCPNCNCDLTIKLSRSHVGAAEQQIQDVGETGYRGVFRDRDKFSARIKIRGVSKYLGSFDTAQEASLAYEKARKEK